MMIRIASTFVLLLALAACEAPPPLPMHLWRGADAALRIMSQRSAAIASASGTAALTLRSADGREVRLDAAFAAAPPRSLRLRAWKLDRAVADWTFTPSGVWAWQADEQGGKPTPGPWTARHADIWPLLFGVIERKPGDTVDEGDSALELTRKIGDLVVRIVIDRATLTVRESHITDSAGHMIQHALLSDYRMNGEVPWPMHITATQGQASFTIEFDDVTLNEPLADEAFTPPTRARPLP